MESHKIMSIGVAASLILDCATPFLLMVTKDSYLLLNRFKPAPLSKNRLLESAKSFLIGHGLGSSMIAALILYRALKSRRASEKTQVQSYDVSLLSILVVVRNPTSNELPECCIFYFFEKFSFCSVATSD